MTPANYRRPSPAMVPASVPKFPEGVGSIRVLSSADNAAKYWSDLEGIKTTSKSLQLKPHEELDKEGHVAIHGSIQEWPWHYVSGEVLCSVPTATTNEQRLCSAG